MCGLVFLSLLKFTEELAARFAFIDAKPGFFFSLSQSGQLYKWLACAVYTRRPPPTTTHRPLPQPLKQAVREPWGPVPPCMTQASQRWELPWSLKKKKKKKRGKVFGPIATCGFNYSRWTVLRIGGWVGGGLVVHYLSLDNVWPLKAPPCLSQGLKAAMANCAISSCFK